MEFISYIASFISIILGLIEPFGKKMRTILTLNFSGNLLVGTSYLLIGGHSGAAICFAACVLGCINYVFDIKDKKIPTWLVAVYAVGFLSINLITFGAWYDVLALAASMLFVLSIVQNEAKYYRVLYAFNSTIWIFYDFLAGAYANLLTHIVLFVATFLAIALHDIKTARKNKKTSKKA
ncbi:MAG: YgjV family protein [Ruminococcaceae bacterium]|nr:YgjV family protein [Oscillospiraceae bacterium]